MHKHPSLSQSSQSEPSSLAAAPSYSQQQRPFLKYAGGKQRLLRTILPLLPAPAPGGRYIEPFLGAGSVLLNKHVPVSLAGDANPDLMAIWVALQARPLELIREAAKLFAPENNSQDAYLRIRSEYNDAACRFDRAVRLLYLNRFGFNGLYRVNKSGRFNVPFGRPSTLPSLPEKELLSASNRLPSVQLHSGSFQALLGDAGRGDVVYCDPPYLAGTDESSFVSYTSNSFTYKDQVELRDLALAAAGRGAFVAISNHANELTRDLYKGFACHELTVHRSISSRAASRGSEVELVAVVRP